MPRRPLQTLSSHRIPGDGLPHSEGWFGSAETPSEGRRAYRTLRDDSPMATAFRGMELPHFGGWFTAFRGMV